MDALDCPADARIVATSVVAAIVLVVHAHREVADSAEVGHIAGIDQHHTYGIGP
jgi:hypothetical protein